MSDPSTRLRDPITSHLAAKRAAKRAITHRIAVLRAYRWAMRTHQSPITNDRAVEIVNTICHVKASAQSVRSRKKTLAEEGLIRHVDDLGTTEQGGRAGRWEISMKGLEYLAQMEGEQP